MIFAFILGFVLGAYLMAYVVVDKAKTHDYINREWVERK
jgi:hypothetical protein